MLKLIIYVIFLFAFLGNSLVEYGLISPYLTLVTEAFVYLLLLYSFLAVPLKAGRYACPLWFPFSFFMAVAFGSIVVNNYFNLQPVASIRLILRFYLFYLALINLGLNDTILRKINKLLFILFIIQLPVVAYKFSYRGISEDTIGTYATHGGGLTSIIPIVALGYLAGYFTFYKRRLSYILLAIGFILLGIVGEKRALLFIYPIAFIGIYFLTNIIGKNENIIKQLGRLACVALLSIAVSAVILKYHKGYNYAENLDYLQALKYAKEYTTKREGDKAGGRVATTQLAFELTSKTGNLLFGFGPGCLTGSQLNIKRKSDRRLIPIYQSYGITGLVFILIEYGMLGVIAIVLICLTFAHRCWQWYKSEKEPYWKAFAMGSLVFTVHNTFIFFCYNKSPLIGDTITPVYFYAMATMYIRVKEITQVKRTERLSV